jgi:hypothetical protein
MRLLIESLLSTALIGSLLLACGEDPVVSDESRDLMLATCAPFGPGIDGYEYPCQGLGNGWLKLRVYPVGEQPTECVNWGEQGRPDNPTVADCVPIDLTAPPLDVPGPAACCTPAVESEQIVEQCASDCGFAACKLAVARMRAAALALPNSGARGVVRGDLLALSSSLATPMRLAGCASLVAEANGEVVTVPLGRGPSSKAKFGHVQDATLFLRCALDPLEPFAASEQSCVTPPNIPD